MISKIGFKRTFLLVGLTTLLTVLGLTSYFLLGPKVLDVRQKLDATNADLSKLQSDVDKMRADFELFQKEKALYESIKHMGFFNNQDRVLARERFDTLQRLSKVISARYEIKSANLITSDKPESADYVVIESPITVELSALDDLDIYRFIYYLNYGFPGHITISEMNIARASEVTADVLKLVGTGSPPELVSAKMSVVWRTMVRRQDILPEDVVSLVPQSEQGAGEVAP